MRPFLFAIVLSGLLGFSGQARVQAQDAQLAVSTKTPSVGEVFVLQIHGSGRQVGSPGILDIEGISVLRNAGTSTSMSLINGQYSSKKVFSYQVMADREGELEIPGIELTVEGKKIKTNAIKLTVKKAGSTPQPPHLQPQLPPGVPSPSRPNTTRRAPGGRGQSPPYPAKIDEQTAYIKVVPEREEIYVGETAEVEIKAYLDAGIPIVNFARELSLQGEDFIFQPTIGPDAQLRNIRGRRAYQFKQEQVGGRVFNVLTYRTTMTAVKPGTFTLEPVDFTAIIQLPPQRRRARPRSPLDSLLGGDPFDDPFFDMLNNRRRELHLKSQPEEVKVLSLPAEGRPPHFRGAIGTFTFDVKADKETLAVDEALTLTGTIVGYGNFERINELEATSDAQWKAYPPKIHFESGDDLNISGEKKFEYTYIATAPAEETPSIAFCYFDPEAKDYVDFPVKRLPVSVTGSAVSSLTNQDLAALADQAADPGQMVLAAVTGEPTSRFIRSGGGHLLGTGTLLAVNGSAALLALGLVAWQWRRRDRPPTRQKRQRLLMKERTHLLQQLRSEQDDADAFGQKLVRVLALTEWIELPERVECDAWESARKVVTACPQESEAREALEQCLDWVNARRWSSEKRESATLSREMREAWLGAIDKLDRPRGRQ